jgi:hypothetical protein
MRQSGNNIDTWRKSEKRIHQLGMARLALSSRLDAEKKLVAMQRDPTGNS